MIDWTHWHNEPFLIGGLIFLGWLYAILTGPLRSKVTSNKNQETPSPPSPSNSMIRPESSFLSVGIQFPISNDRIEWLVRTIRRAHGMPFADLSDLLTPLDRPGV